MQPSLKLSFSCSLDSRGQDNYFVQKKIGKTKSDEKAAYKSSYNQIKPQDLTIIRP